MASLCWAESANVLSIHANKKVFCTRTNLNHSCEMDNLNCRVLITDARIEKIDRKFSKS